jgi:hypothetical protein
VSDEDMGRLIERLDGLSREEWHKVDEAMLAIWRAKFEGTELFPVRL